MVDCKPFFMPLKVNEKLNAHVGDVIAMVTMYKKKFDLVQDYEPKFELHNGLGESIYAASIEAALRCCQPYIRLCKRNNRLYTILGNKRADAVVWVNRCKVGQ